MMTARTFDSAVHGTPGSWRAQDRRQQADCAQPPEREACFYAALKRLGSSVLGLQARKQLFMALRSSFPQAKRVAFLCHVNGGGK